MKNVEVGYPTFLNSVKNGLCGFKERKFTVWIVIFQFYPNLYLYIIFLLTLSELMMWYYPVSSLLNCQSPLQERLSTKEKSKLTKFSFFGINEND